MFDCFCVLLLLPVLIPVLLVIGLAVRITSGGPVLSFQKRVGQGGRIFTMMKFRTLKQRGKSGRTVARTGNRVSSPFGPFLRKSGLENLPQLWNVLIGDMSLVGPAPGLPEHPVSDIHCRPGMMGAATAAFASEANLLVHLRRRGANHRDAIRRVRQQLDREYTSRATFSSDLSLFIQTVSRHSDTALVEHMLREELARDEVQVTEPMVLHAHVATAAGSERALIREEQFTEA